MLTLSALQQWGAGHVSVTEDLEVVPVARGSRRRLRVAFVDEDGAVVDARDAQFAPGASVTDS